VNSRIFFHKITTVLLGAILITAPSLVQARDFKVLHQFTGGADGAYPVAGLIQDAAGNLYGTTEGGNGTGYGTVFQIHTSGQGSVVYTFGAEPDGTYPVSSLIRDTAGNLIGTTSGGGVFGAGSVFKIDRMGHESLLYSFDGGLEGAYPRGGLVRDVLGNLYGTTETGGSGASFGTVFRLDTKGVLTVLHRFVGGVEGEYPKAGLVADPTGNLYGTTAGDGASLYGTIFKLDASGTETVLHYFTGAPDGAFPIAGLVRDPAGNLYGTTQKGGIYDNGTVFRLDGTGTETVLYNFTGRQDGKWPVTALITDSAGDLFGTTFLGGAFDQGAIFKLDPSGNEVLLYSFTGRLDGSFPWGGLLRDKNGILYGTTINRGAFGYGTVFKLTL
jgi:uncharacterized repeat protein (TIGR03803 family)